MWYLHVYTDLYVPSLILMRLVGSPRAYLPLSRIFPDLADQTGGALTPEQG